jgi:hypothetical protein
MAIEKDQIYTDCDPRSSVRIRIKSYRRGDARAQVVDAVTGGRQRGLLVSSLHASATTETGKPRRRGYALVQQEQQ